MHAASDQFSSNLVELIPSMTALARFLSRSGDETDDLVQETLARAMRYRDQFRPGTNLRAWVLTILRNEFNSRRRRAWREVDLDDTIDVGSTAAGQDAVIELDDLRLAMNSLADCKQQALLMIAVAGLSYDEAAAIVGCTAGTIKSRVSRARQELRGRLTSGVLQRDGAKPHQATAAIVQAAGLI